MSARLTRSHTYPLLSLLMPFEPPSRKKARPVPPSVSRPPVRESLTRARLVHPDATVRSPCVPADRCGSCGRPSLMVLATRNDVGETLSFPPRTNNWPAPLYFRPPRRTGNDRRLSSPPDWIFLGDAPAFLPDPSRTSRASVA